MSETAPAGTFTPRGRLGKPGSCGLPMPRLEMKFIDAADPSRDVPARRARRDLRQGAERDEGLLEEAGRDRGRHDGGRILPHRRRRLSWTRTASSSSSTAPRTCCSSAASTSIRATSRRRSTSTRRSRRSASSACRTTYRGEIPKAFVKLKPGAPPLTLDDLKAFLKDRLGKHEMIGALEIRDALPKTRGRQDLEEGSCARPSARRRAEPSRPITGVAGRSAPGERTEL